MRSWVDEVRDRVQILDVAGQYTRLKRVGSSWRGPCPIHGGTHANFAVSPTRGTFKCFVCGEGGDAFKLVMLKEGMEFLDAAKRLAQQLGVEVYERRVRRSDDEIARVRQQAQLVEQGGGTTAWAALGVAEATVELFKASARRTEAGNELLLPIFAPGQIPMGWARYRVGADAAVRGPIRAGFDPLAADGVAYTLFAPPHIKADLHRSPLIVVDEPAAVVLLHGMGFATAVAPAAGAFAQGVRELLSDTDITRIAELGVRTVSLLLPLDADGADARARWRAVFAAETRLLVHGIELLVVTPSTAMSEGGVAAKPSSSWAWIHEIGSREALLALLANNHRTVDVFQLRVQQVARRVRAGRMRHEDALAKLRPSLEAVSASGDRVLYHAYTAWAARGLGLPSRKEVVRLIDGQAAQMAAEVF